jgi:hypothetical protein
LKGRVCGAAIEPYLGTEPVSLQGILRPKSPLFQKIKINIQLGKFGGSPFSKKKYATKQD